MMARALGASVAVAGRSIERLERLRALGAEVVLELGPDLPRQLRLAFEGRGVDLVFEMVGGGSMRDSLASLNPGGRLVLVGLLGGRTAEIPLDVVLSRRLHVIGSVLRSRTFAEKSSLVAGFRNRFEASLPGRELHPVIDRVIPARNIASALALMEHGGHFGKIVLDWGESGGVV